MSFPSVRIARRAADRLRTGHLWVYRSDLLPAAPGDAAPAFPGGALVTVLDPAGRPLGSALYSDASQIALRLVSALPDLPRERYLADLRERLDSSLALRRLLAPVTEATDAHRLVFSEADGLPGVLIDRYNDLLLLQLLTQGTAQDDVRATVAAVLRAHFAGDGQPFTLWERPDPRIRELEQLAAPPPGPLFSTHPAGDADIQAPTRTTFTLNGVRLAYDAAAGQKTGAFLDQRLNYAAAARTVEASGRRGRALDVCTYQGGFALHLAAVAERVTGIDASRAALEVAEGNLGLNPHLAAAAVNWVEADAFDLLRALDDASRAPAAPASARLPLSPHPAFDAIVLDPPAFAKSKRATEGALRGYKELNLRALRLLAPGGTLVTCSCSHHVALEEFTAVLAAAAADAGRAVQLLAVHGAAPDHPEMLALPETRYLKCLIARVS